MTNLKPPIILATLALGVAGCGSTANMATTSSVRAAPVAAPPASAIPPTYVAEQRAAHKRAQAAAKAKAVAVAKAQQVAREKEEGARTATANTPTRASQPEPYPTLESIARHECEANGEVLREGHNGEKRMSRWEEGPKCEPKWERECVAEGKMVTGEGGHLECVNVPKETKQQEVEQAKEDLEECDGQEEDPAVNCKEEREALTKSERR